MHKVITSLQNAQVKNTVSLLHKSRERKEQGRLVAEGWREVGLALRQGWKVESLWYDPELTPAQQVDELAGSTPLEIIACNRAVMEKIAYRTSVSNVVAIIQQPGHLLENFQITQEALILVLEQVEKPGNLGAMLRTADGAGADAVLVCDPLVDLYNPNAIRASLGALFTVPVFAVTKENALSRLRQTGCRVVATYINDRSIPYTAVDFRSACAVVMGSESGGLGAFWVEQADDCVIIPMQGQVDSLNVSASAAVVLFEANRQRLI